MPELPEVEVIRQQLNDHIVGATIQNIWIGREDIVRYGLQGLPWYEGARAVSYTHLTLPTIYSV